MTYPHSSIAGYISERFVAFRAMLDNRDHAPLFRANRIIWTPTVGFMDRNGAMHYHSVGFLPPPEFISALKIGRARCLLAWTRSAEAVEELAGAIEVANTFTPEALYWLGIARFLQRRETTGMWEAWDRLVELYPDSPWAKRIYSRSPTDVDY